MRNTMPNWCDNTISISGNAETIKQLKEFVGRPLTEGGEEVKEPLYSLANIMPSTPDAEPVLGEASKSTGHDDWYHNNINSWGTKWDVYGESCFMCDYKEGDEQISYSYQSAWSPPTPTTQRLSEIFPELIITHTYYESGMDFWGIITYKGGEEISAEDGELSHEAWSILGESCWNCTENDDPEYWYSDCPSAIEAEKEAEVSA
jgi:hypothetical protein